MPLKCWALTANDDDRDNPYIFERDVVFQRGRGETSLGRIDLYRRGAFVCEGHARVLATAKNQTSCALSGLSEFHDHQPRALPWAITCCRVAAHKVNAQLIGNMEND